MSLSEETPGPLGRRASRPPKTMCLNKAGKGDWGKDVSRAKVSESYVVSTYGSELGGMSNNVF